MHYAEKIHEKECSDPLVMSATVIGGDGHISAVPDPHPTPNLLITKSSLLINGNTIPRTAQAKHFTVFLYLPFSLIHTQTLGKFWCL